MWFSVNHELLDHSRRSSVKKFMVQSLTTAPSSAWCSVSWWCLLVLIYAPVHSCYLPNNNPSGMMGWTMSTTTKAKAATATNLFGRQHGNIYERKTAIRAIQTGDKDYKRQAVYFATELQQRQNKSSVLRFHQDGSPFSWSRKFFLGHGIIISMSMLVSSTACGNPAAAADATSVSEAVRRGASNLPGYGPTDVFYPKSWQGTWKVRRQVVLFSGGDSVSAPTTATTLEYTIRFIPSIQDGAVVADRGYNQANLEVAQLQSREKDSASAAGVQSVQWTETNPNDLLVQMTDGATKNIKVTKRATERTETTVQSSEFQRFVTMDRGGIPNVTARRVLTKWKAIVAEDADIAGASTEPTVLEALEIVYDMGSQGDPLSFSMGNNGEPTVLSKSRLFLQRY